MKTSLDKIALPASRHFSAFALIAALSESSRAFIGRQGARFVAIILILSLYELTRLPEISKAERGELAKNIHFKQSALPELPGSARHSSRSVNPSLQGISAWISSVGAAVALNDLDGDGLPNDLCYVDTRSDQVIIAPVPGTGQRYNPFKLNPGESLYKPATMAPMGCLPGDFNETGMTSVLVYYWGRTPIVFLRKQSEGLVKQPLSADDYVAQEIVPGGDRWYTNAATLADLDGDSHTDLVIGNYFKDGSRILDASALTTEEMQHSMSRASNGGGLRLLRWEGKSSGPNPSVKYEVVDRAVDDTLTHGWTLAVGVADLDGDFLPDIYLANDFGPDRLLRNVSKLGEFHFVAVEGTRTLTTPSSKVLGHDSFKGMGVDFGDLNGDGLQDVCVSNITDPYALEESNFVFLSTGETELMRRGIAPYIERSEALGLSRSGWGWDFKLGDFTNSGKLQAIQATGFLNGADRGWPVLHELAMGNDQLLQHPANWPRFRPGEMCLSCQDHNPFFILAPNGRYYDIAPELGLDSPQISRGIATADADGDGRLDFAVANQWGTSYFYHNESAEVGEFLGLHLRLPVNGTVPLKTAVYRGHLSAEEVLSRPAIGAEASVRLADGRQLVSQVDGGNGHSGKRSPDLQFGLGRSLRQEKKIAVALRWRDLNGVVRSQVIELDGPGWYTVVLGSPEE